MSHGRNLQNKWRYQVASRQNFFSQHQHKIKQTSVENIEKYK